MSVPSLALRIPLNRPLTPGEMDGNLIILRSAILGDQVLFAVAHDPTTGELRPLYITTAALAALSVTEPKLANDAVIARVIKDQEVTAAKIANALAGNGLLKAANGDPLSVNLDNVTLEFDGSSPKKIRLKTSVTTYNVAPTTISAGLMVNVAHSLTAVPKIVSWKLVNISNIDSYTVGDEIPVELVTVAQFPVMSGGANATNVFLNWSKSSLSGAKYPAKTASGIDYTADFDASKWNVKC